MVHGRRGTSWKGSKRGDKTLQGGVEVQERMQLVMETLPGWFETEDPIAWGDPRAKGEEVSHKLPRFSKRKTLKHTKTTKAENKGR